MHQRRSDGLATKALAYLPEKREEAFLPATSAPRPWSWATGAPSPWGLSS